MTQFATQRITDEPFAEIGAVTHEGCTYTAMGAVEQDGILYAYVVQPADDVARVTSWDGSTSFGRVVRRSRYTGGFGARMEALRVRRPDGSQWYGRYGYDGGQLIRLRPCA